MFMSCYLCCVLVCGLILRLDVSKILICCLRTRVKPEMERLDRMTEPRMRWCYFVLDAGRPVRPKEGAFAYIDCALKG